MPNRYANNPAFQVQTPRSQPASYYGRQAARAQQDRQWAQMAQMAGEGVGLAGGTALGLATGDPLGGMGAGAKAGAALGGMGSSYFNNEADQADDPMRAQQIRRMALLAAMRGMPR